tara:strand:- start:988 stop:1191 length:204 start_codon:yes stop_codon:yes gene_type:complete
LRKNESLNNNKTQVHVLVAMKRIGDAIPTSEIYSVDVYEHLADAGDKLNELRHCRDMECYSFTRNVK